MACFGSGWMWAQDASKTDLRLADRSARIETAWLNVTTVGSILAPRSAHMYFDGIVVAKRYIGPDDRLIVVEGWLSPCRYGDRAPIRSRFRFQNRQVPRGGIRRVRPCGQFPGDLFDELP